MTFRDYVFISSMNKVTADFLAKGIHRILGNDEIEISPEAANAIYWQWFFEIERDGIADWNQFIESGNYSALESMLIDFQCLACANLLEALGELADEVVQTPAWISTAMDVYMSVFGDYVKTMIPDIMPVMKNILSRNEDEGVSDPISF